MFEINKMPASIDIGIVGETNFRPIRIDMSAWMVDTPDGVPSIIHIRPGETEENAYIAATTFDRETNVLTWLITAGDLGVIDGEGTARIWLEELDDQEEVAKRGKSLKIKTIIHGDEALDPTDEPPAAQAAWLEQMTALKVATVEAAEDAEDAKDAAEDAQEAAEDSAEDAEAYAVGKRGGEDVESGDPAYNNNSKYYAVKAWEHAGDADNAKIDAVAAKNAAVGAKNDAVSAKNDAVSAKGTAEAKALVAEGFAVGQQNGEDVASGSPYYQNNAKYYSGNADSQATAAGNSATTAGNKALIAEGYAVGKQNGEDVTSGSPYYQNNAKYYSDQASSTQSSKANIIHDSVTNVPIATVPDGAAVPLSALKIAVEPVQDLHGQAYPYPAGAKNKIDASLITNENKYIAANNGVPTIPGTQGVEWRHTNYIPVTPGEVLFFGEINASAGTAGSAFYDSDKTYISGFSATQLANASNVWTVPEGVAYLRHSFRVDEGYNTNWQTTVYIVKNSDTHEWSPYSNICPITGWTGAQITAIGSDLTDSLQIEQGYYNAEGTAVAENGMRGTANYIPCKSGQKFYFRESASYSQSRIRVHEYDANKTWLRQVYVSQSALPLHEESVGTWATSNDAKYIRFSFPNYDFGSILFAEYNNTFEITFPDSAGTVHSGQIDVLTGELTVDGIYVTITGDDLYSYSESNASAITRILTNIYSGYDSVKICDTYPVVASAVTTTGQIGIRLNTTNGRIYIYDERYTSLSQAQELLNENPIHVVANLATPLTYQLDPITINTLLGINNVWADCGDILLMEYGCDTKQYIEKRLSASQNLMELIITANREDGMKATKAYSTGNLLIVNGTLYRATTSIANGATLTPGTNVIATTVAAELAALA